MVTTAVTALDLPLVHSLDKHTPLRALDKAAVSLMIAECTNLLVHCSSNSKHTVSVRWVMVGVLIVTESCMSQSVRHNVSWDVIENCTRSRSETGC